MKKLFSLYPVLLLRLFNYEFTIFAYFDKGKKGVEGVGWVKGSS